jgi:DNA-binding NarL/FixJ family response regulator
MYVNMDKRPRNQKPLGAARDFLHCMIREQRAAIEELLATNRELEKLLDEVLVIRADLRGAVEATGEPEAAGAPKHPAEAAGRNINQIKNEVETALQKGSQAIRDSTRIRQRSRTLRELLRRPAAGPPTQGGLSRREQQVLTLIVEGKSSKQIAAALGISFKTAVTHRASIMGKLDVHEIASVVREAIRRGLV